MAWSSTWSQSSYTNNDVKFLLADLCNAINERLNIISTKVDFNIYGGTSQSPTSSSFVGMPVTGGASTWSGVCAQIDSAIDTLFPSTTVWLDSTFTTQYTRAAILSAIGYTESDIASSNWRSPNFYKGIKAMMPYARYLAVNQLQSILTPYFYGIDGVSPPAPYDSDPQIAWDNATDEQGIEADGIGASLENDNTYMYYVAYKTTDELTYTYTTPSGYASATFVKIKVALQSIATATDIVPLDLTFTFGDTGIEMPLSTESTYQSEYVDFNSMTVPLSVDFTDVPFDTTSDGSGSFVVTPSTAKLCYDMNSAYSYT